MVHNQVELVTQLAVDFRNDALDRIQHISGNQGCVPQRLLCQSLYRCSTASRASSVFGRMSRSSSERNSDRSATWALLRLDLSVEFGIARTPSRIVVGSSVVSGRLARRRSLGAEAMPEAGRVLQQRRDTFFRTYFAIHVGQKIAELSTRIQ